MMQSARRVTALKSAKPNRAIDTRIETLPEPRLVVREEKKMDRISDLSLDLGIFELEKDFESV